VISEMRLSKPSTALILTTKHIATKTKYAHKKKENKNLNL